MKRLAVLSSLLILGCLSDSDDDGGSADPIGPGTYRAAFSQKWFEDDPAPRKFVDEQVLGTGQEGEARMYVVQSGDTALLCEGMYSWRQEGATLKFWGGRQRCKDPDYLAGGFDAWDYYDDTSSSAIRNVTATGFEMQGTSIDGVAFWARYSLKP